MNEKEHHSLADWDYSVPGPYICDTVFVSSPTCLAALYKGAITRQGYAMCKLDSAKNVFDGRIVTYFRLGSIMITHIYIYYRCQAYPTSGTGLPLNSYMFRPSTHSFRIDRRIAGSSATLYEFSFPIDLQLYTWYKVAITWWQYLQPDMTKMLRHTIALYGDSYNGEIGHFDDSGNTWEASATNQIGFTLLHQNKAYETAIDNTEIWKRLT